MLPSISTETKASANSRSSALVFFVSSALFQELSKACTRAPSSEELPCAANAITIQNGNTNPAVMVHFSDNQDLLTEHANAKSQLENRMSIPVTHKADG